MKGRSDPPLFFGAPPGEPNQTHLHTLNAACPFIQSVSASRLTKIRFIGTKRFCDFSV